MGDYWTVHQWSIHQLLKTGDSTNNTWDLDLQDIWVTNMGPILG